MLKNLSNLLLVAVSGATVAYYLNLPLPFFLGPAISVMLLSFSGFTFKIPEIVWTTTRVVIGIYLASKLSPSIVNDVIKWSGSFIMQFFMIFISSLACASVKFSSKHIHSIKIGNFVFS